MTKRLYERDLMTRKNLSTAEGESSTLKGRQEVESVMGSSFGLESTPGNVGFRSWERRGKRRKTRKGGRNDFQLETVGMAEDQPKGNCSREVIKTRNAKKEKK